MDVDDFGEIYGDEAMAGLSSCGAASLHSSYTGFAVFDDEMEMEKPHAAMPAGFAIFDDEIELKKPSPPRIGTTSMSIAEFQQADRPEDRDSDEDDDMLLLGYNSKSGSACRKVLSMEIEDRENGVSGKFIEIPPMESIAENGLSSQSLKSSRAFGVCLTGIMLTKEKESGNLPDRHPGNPGVLNHTVTIPGLSTRVSAPFNDMEDSGDASHDDWGQQQVGNPHLRSDAGVSMNATDAWDTDSDDDLCIVLNTDYAYYAPGEKGVSVRYEDKEDEDDDDLIIFAGGELSEEGEDQLLQASDNQAIQGSGAGEKPTDTSDSKSHLDKVLAGVPLPLQGSGGYGYHNYSSPYKYVRAGTTSVYNALFGQTPGGRGGPLKLISGRGDWCGSGRGAFAPHSIPQFSSWSALSSYEFTLPPSMTVFEIDLDSFDDKPWHQPTVDISDFFNFGFVEATWKDYCKQLTQLRMESTMQSKIRVYESGRNEQDYDPDLPPELAFAAGLQEAGDKIQQRLTETDAPVSTGRRGYMSMPLGRPIEVEGGLGDRRPSADSRKQRFRDCDTILLLDAAETEDKEIGRLQDDNLGPFDGEEYKYELEEQQLEEEQEDEGEELLAGKPRAAYRMDQEKHPWQKERMSTVMSKPLAEDRRHLDLIQSHSISLHQDAVTKPNSITAEKDSKPSDEDDAEADKDVAAVLHDEEFHGGLPVGQRIKDSIAITSRERILQDVQADSSGCLSKRQRSVSPNGSHTAPWDNGDTRKATRSGIYIKESGKSGESAMDEKDVLPHRKKHRSHPEISREDQHRNLRQDSEAYKKRPTSSRHETESEFLFADSLLEAIKRPKQGLMNKEISKELLKLSKDRDETQLKERKDQEKRNYVAREAVNHKEKVGRSEAVKRDAEDKETAHHNDKVGSQLEVRKRRQVEKRGRHESRRKVSDDRRDRAREDSQQWNTREIQHRGKDVEPTDWHSCDRRKNEDEYRRKDRLENADTTKERERSTVERRDLDSDQRLQKKEEDLAKKEKHKDRHKSKARYKTSGEREDLRQRNTDNQESQGRANKDDERSLYSSRSRRHNENRTERAWRGMEESRLTDPARSSKAKRHSKDRRKGLDDNHKEKDRLNEGLAAHSSTDHEGLSVSGSYDRAVAKYTELPDDPRILEKGFKSDKHKFNNERAKEFDKEASELATQLGDSTDAIKQKSFATEIELVMVIFFCTAEFRMITRK